MGNQVFGFDEPDSAALVLNADRFGEACLTVIRGNTFQNCARVVKENRPGTWAASHAQGNLYIDCGDTPKP